MAAAAAHVPVLKSGFEVRIINLHVTRERTYRDGEVASEHFSIARNDELLLERGSFLDAEQAISEYITRDDLDV
jgi:hypothetical protein